MSQLFLQLLIVGTEMVSLSLPPAQLHLQVLYLLLGIILHEIRNKSITSQSTFWQETEVQALRQKQKAGGGSRGSCDEDSPSSPRQRTRPRTHTQPGWGTLLVSSAQQGTGLLGVPNTHYQSLLGLLQVLLQVLEGC